MKLLIVGLGSMGKRRARLAKGIDPAVSISGVDSAPDRREEVKALGIRAYESVPARWPRAGTTRRWCAPRP